MIALQVAVSGSSDGGYWLLAAGPLAALATYWLIHRYYRNQDKSHAFESETLVEAKPVQGGAVKVDHIRKTRHGSIEGDNSSNHRVRVRRFN